jgi:uncharacterized protein YjhX (UPF0386 family)
MNKRQILIISAMALTAIASISLFAQVGQSYRNGSVWRVAFVKVKPGMDSTYLTVLANGWKKEREAMKQKGLILSYKVLTTETHSKDDWNLLLMTKFKSLAAIESEQGKRDEVIREITGNAQQQVQSFTNLSDVREDIGYRIAREIVFTPEN